MLPPQVLLSQLDFGFLAEPTDRHILQGLWEKANRSYNSFGSASRSFAGPEDIRPLENVDRLKIEKMLDRIRLYQPFDSHPTSICTVRMSKLITPQIVINKSRAEKRAVVKQKMTTSELFDVAFDSGGHPEAITRQTLGMFPNGGALLFTSYDEDIRLHHPPQYRQIPINEKDQRSPSFESVCVPVGGGLPFASVFRVQIATGITRLILNNGMHRLYRLAEAGYEWCPLVVSDLVPLEFTDPFVDLPRPMLLDLNSNPPLITDFLNEDLVIPLNYFTLLKTIRLNWNFEHYVTVLR